MAKLTDEERKRILEGIDTHSYVQVLIDKHVSAERERIIEALDKEKGLWIHDECSPSFVVEKCKKIIQGGK